MASGTNKVFSGAPPGDNCQSQSLPHTLLHLPGNCSNNALFTDGCSFSHPQEGLKAAYAIVRKLGANFEEVEKGKIKGKESQLAELKAVIRALE